MSWLPSPEQRSPRDLAITAALIVLAFIAVGGAWFTSQQRQVDHSVADVSTNTAKGDTSSSAPESVREVWREDSGVAQLVAREDGALVVQGTRVTMLDSTTGQERWHYDQGREICGVASPSMWKEAVVVFRGPKGCGEVISFDLTSGQYAHTRDALAQDDVTVFEGNRRAGTYAPERVEIWRDDLVRTVEVGQQEAPHQPNQQEYTDCRFTSAATAENLLATTQQCPGEEKKLVRLLATTPEDSDEPEILHEFTVPAGAELIAAADDAALIAIPATEDEGARIQKLTTSGDFETTRVESPRPGVEINDTAITTTVAGAVALWFDGETLHAFDATNLEARFTIEGALGVGAMMGDRLLVPVADGIAVINPSNGKEDRVIPVDRGDEKGPITLKVPGPDSIVEQRSGSVVGYSL